MNDTEQNDPGLNRGAPILVVLHSPREKCWGILDEITGAGVFLRGLDLNAFDDWLSAVVHNEPFLGFATLFFPLWLEERVSKDEPSGALPSLAQQAEQRTGRTLKDLLRNDKQPS